MSAYRAVCSKCETLRPGTWRLSTRALDVLEGQLKLAEVRPVAELVCGAAGCGAVMVEASAEQFAAFMSDLEWCESRGSDWSDDEYSSGFNDGQESVSDDVRDALALLSPVRTSWQAQS